MMRNISLEFRTPRHSRNVKQTHLAGPPQLIWSKMTQAVHRGTWLAAGWLVPESLFTVIAWDALQKPRSGVLLCAV